METGIVKYVSELPWLLVIVLCLTLGLAPFSPPHIWEKLQLLFRGELVRLIDWFDFFLHGFPWALLIIKIFVAVKS